MTCMQILSSIRRLCLRLNAIWFVLINAGVEQIRRLTIRILISANICITVSPCLCSVIGCWEKLFNFHKSVKREWFQPSRRAMDVVGLQEFCSFCCGTFWCIHLLKNKTGTWTGSGRSHWLWSQDWFMQWFDTISSSGIDVSEADVATKWLSLILV